MASVAVWLRKSHAGRVRGSVRGCLRSPAKQSRRPCSGQCEERRKAQQDGAFGVSQLGQTYRVDWTESLSPTAWQAATDNVPGTGYDIGVPDTGMLLETQRFYRTVILLP